MVTLEVVVEFPWENSFRDLGYKEERKYDSEKERYEVESQCLMDTLATCGEAHKQSVNEGSHCSYIGEGEE